MSTPNEQQPRKIEHFVDTDRDPTTNEYSYFYNYLLYTFEHSNGVVTARSYLDTPSEVSILKCPIENDLEEKLTGILTYLKLRYLTVKHLGPSGYIEI